MANNRRDPASVPGLNPDFYNPQPQDVAFFTLNNKQVLMTMNCWNNISCKSKQRHCKVHLPFLLTDIHVQFTQHSADFITISVYVVSTSFISRLLPCPVVSRRSASSKNATGLSWSTSVVVVSFAAFSQQLVFLIVYYQSALRWETLAVFDGWPMHDIIASDILKGK